MKNILQTKDQDKTSHKELNAMEASNMPDKKFKVTVRKMLTALERTTNELRENFKKHIENIRKNQPELKNTITERKNI